jgi:hypothetical protein
LKNLVGSKKDQAVKGERASIFSKKLKSTEKKIGQAAFFKKRKSN